MRRFRIKGFYNFYTPLQRLLSNVNIISVKMYEFKITYFSLLFINFCAGSRHQWSFANWDIIWKTLFNLYLFIIEKAWILTKIVQLANTCEHDVFIVRIWTELQTIRRIENIHIIYPACLNSNCAPARGLVGSCIRSEAKVYTFNK